MNRCNLMCGDSIELIKNIPDNSIDLIVTDPPYEVSTRSIGNTLIDMGVGNAFNDLENLNIVDGYDIESYAKEFIRVMKEPNIYVFCNKKQIPKYLDIYFRKYGCMFDILFWIKNNALPTYYNKYLTDVEYLLYFHKGKGKCFPQSYEDAKTYYFNSINYKDKKLYNHPSIKPLNLVEKVIRNSSKENQLILDPFMGSGTTGVACKKLHRNFIGIEINKDYFNIAEQRIKNIDRHKKLF